MTKRDPREENAVEHLQQVWESLAKEDPLWAICSTPWKRGGKWNLEEFFATGEQEISQALEILDARGVEIERSTALDFGCGVGRLTQALARRFESVCGIDISPTMIETAQRLNQYPDHCRYVLNVTNDLRQFSDECFAFIYSVVVLQHIPPELSRHYLLEFARVAAPGATVVFQLPSCFRIAEGLPPHAWAASIQWRNEAAVYDCRSRCNLDVSVKNVSTSSWHFDEQNPLMLGNHWLDINGQVLRMDDGRAVLPNNVGPGEPHRLNQYHRGF